MTFSNIPLLYEVIVVSLLTVSRHETTTTFCDWEKISISKDIFFLLVVAISTSNTLVVPIFEIEWRSSDTNWYHPATNWIQVVARKKERKKWAFLKSYSFSKKSKGVPLPFHKTLLELSLCDEINEPNALIPSLSRSKSGREWHPHLPSYVSEPTNVNLNISR